MTDTTWRLQKVEVFRDGILDEQYSGYSLLKNDIEVCKFSMDSLNQVKEFFTNLEIPN